MMLMLGRYFSSIVARQSLGFISFTLFVGGSKLGARSVSSLKRVQLLRFRVGGYQSIQSNLHFGGWCLEYDFWHHTLPRSPRAKSQTGKVMAGHFPIYLQEFHQKIQALLGGGLNTFYVQPYLGRFPIWRWVGPTTNQLIPNSFENFNQKKWAAGYTAAFCQLLPTVWQHGTFAKSSWGRHEWEALKGWIVLWYWGRGDLEIRRESQLRERWFLPLFTRFEHHPRWLGIGFLNHQQY